MNTVQFLDLYRIPIISDKAGFFILSLLYHDGPKKEDEISESTAMSGHSIKAKVRELFQSNYIVLSRDNQLQLSYQGELLLSKLGVPEIAAKSLVARYPLPKHKTAFLQACIEARSDSDETLAQLYFAQLKALHIAMKSVKKKHKRKYELDPKILFTLIVGLDPHSHRLGAEGFCDEVISWHRTNSSTLWSDMGKTLYDYRNSLTRQCHTALFDAIESDQIFYLDKEEPKRVSEAVFLVTLTRVLTVLLYDTPDPILCSSFSRNPNMPQKVLSTLKSWRADIDSWIMRIVKPLISHSDSDDYTESSLAGLFYERLFRTVRRQSLTKKSASEDKLRNKLALQAPKEHK